jgi:pimeloyl-ACP methyl ester carboxylesterase
VDAAGPAFTPQSVPIGFVIARLPVVNRVSEHLLPRSLIRSSLTNVYGDPSRVTSALVDRYFELTLREGNRRALGQRLAGWVPGEGQEKIATLRLPTLILWGGQDRLIPPEVAKVFKRDIPGSELVMFDDLGHVPHEEQPQRTVQPVLAFLAQPPKASP